MDVRVRTDVDATLNSGNIVSIRKDGDGLVFVVGNDEFTLLGQDAYQVAELIFSYFGEFDCESVI
jgi:hypothetical protein